ncbi:hypothetical protein [Nocardia farcinica]|uniref:hypothetical protein n=1 Tax=Nocardia farcinica TaxID=37329 RepID=UPI0024571EAE|nr:hypothetical protein [Nocardia farcinica]
MNPTPLATPPTSTPRPPARQSPPTPAPSGGSPAALAVRRDRYRRAHSLRAEVDDPAHHIVLPIGGEYRAVTMPAELGEQVRRRLAGGGISAPVIEHRRSRRWTFLTAAAGAGSLGPKDSAHLFRMFATIAATGSDVVLPSPEDERTGCRTWVEPPAEPAELPPLTTVVDATLALGHPRPRRPR